MYRFFAILFLQNDQRSQNLYKVKNVFNFMVPIYIAMIPKYTHTHELYLSTERRRVDLLERMRFV